VAVTDAAALIVTVHAPVPEQAPLQPANVDPASGVAVSETEVPVLKLAVQVPGQVMPVGLLVTVPVPAPAVITVSGTLPGEVRSNVAMMLAPVVRSTVQVAPEALVQPVQPVNVDPAAGFAVSVIVVPEPKLASSWFRS